MVNVIEPLYKSRNSILFGWNKEVGAVTYNVYVGLGPSLSLMTLLATKIPNIPDDVPETRGKITYSANITDVQTLLSLPPTIDFTNHVLYFTITYVNSSSVESPLSESVIVEVPPVGIIGRTMKDDPTINRHGYVFSDNLQRWTKAIGASSGATIIDSADFYKSNLVTEFSWDGTNLSTVKSYPSDATLAGMPAKLSTYIYSGSILMKIVVTDSTV